jgi:biofilm PGA synthesis protein PgaD
MSNTTVKGEGARSNLHPKEPVAVSSEYKRPLIIRRPELQSGLQLWSSSFLTVIFWGLWFYLFMPLLSLLAWAAGLMMIYELMVQNLTLPDLWHTLKVYGVGIGVLLVLYLGYAFMAYIRFRQMERRKQAPEVSPGLLAASHNLDLATLHTLQSGQSVVLPERLLERMFEQR